jgi:formate hydrogenlyase subunit 4
MVIVAECGRIPVDNPGTHLELTMIHEAMVLEYSGRFLAMIEWAAQLKLLIYAVLAINLFNPWGIAHNATPAALALAGGLLAVKLGVFGVLLAVFETLQAKLRLFAVPTFLLLAFTLALSGLLSFIVLEAA